MIATAQTFVNNSIVTLPLGVARDVYEIYLLKCFHDLGEALIIPANLMKQIRFFHFFCFGAWLKIFNSIQFNSIQFNSIQFNSIQFNSIQFNSIQFNSIQFNSIKFISDQIFF